MTIQEIDSKKAELLKQVEPLIKKKKELYSNMDISSPMSEDEKELNSTISQIFGIINQLILERRKLTSYSDDKES